MPSPFPCSPVIVNGRERKPQQKKKKVLLQGLAWPAHPIVYENMNESLILKAAMLTKGESGSSGFDADGWRKTLTWRSFGTTLSDIAQDICTVC